MAASIAASVSALLLLTAPSASALVTDFEGATTTVGLQPRSSATVLDGMLEANELGVVKENALPETFANASANPVLHASDIYAIYWDPTAHYHGDWQHVIDTFLQGVGAESGALANVFAVDTQYTDKSNKPASYSTTFRAAYTDTNPYPTRVCTDPRELTEVKAHKIGPITCLTDQQIQEELKAFIAEHNLQKGMGTIFYILTPPGVAVCLDAGGPTGHCSDFAATELEETEEKFEEKPGEYENSFCSYHSDINPEHVASGDGNTALYAVIPWTAGGVGDGQLAKADKTPAYYCQDGGFNPVSKPIEKREKPPVQQEPNQGACPGPDGFCDTGLADLIVNQIAVEQQNTITDPLLESWKDSHGNEATDECRNFFAPAPGGGYEASAAGVGTLYNQIFNGHYYYLNTAFDLAALKLNYPGVPCIPGVRLEPQFTAPNSVSTGDVVGFNGMESTITLDAAFGYTGGGSPQENYATYTWNFGDGTATVSGYAPGAPACQTPWLSPCAASVFHSYQYSGTYTVTLTVTDVGGNPATATNQITVVGASAPSKGGSVAPTGGGAGSPASNAPATVPATVPAPVAFETITSYSLKATLRRGLVIRYSVNEQVAGHFEVLLNRALARRLGIAGTPAVGLPAGSAPELVIAKAILVTTKGGRSAVDIQFSKRTAARLGRLKKVSLIVRLIVRNAASHTPATTTVLTAVTLTH